MSTHDHEQENPEELKKAIELGYEYRDLPFSQMGKHTIVWTFLFLIFVLGATYASFSLYDRFGNRPNASFTTTFERTTIKDNPRKKLPFGPLLQSNKSAMKDIENVRAIEDKATKEYGWVDKEKGIAHEPVDVTIDKLAKEGLPTTEVAPDKPSEEAVPNK